MLLNETKTSVHFFPSFMTTRIMQKITNKSWDMIASGLKCTTGPDNFDHL
jgi:hypothetical protein